MSKEKKPTTATVTINVTPAQKELLDFFSQDCPLQILKHLKESFELSTFCVEQDLIDPYASSNLYHLIEKVAATIQNTNSIHT
tara:strand:- start:38571 stop:38819 length:249 start_codon:yes stop_codon:yes gene_type:complete